MKRRVLIAAALVLALGACATNGTAYRHADGDYSGVYDDGYYAAAGNGHGDYYYDRPQYVYDDYYGYGAGCYRFGYGFVPRGWSFGARFGYDPWFDGFCGYNAWYGFGPYGYPYGWYGPWPHHRHHDADDGRFGALIVRALGAQDHPAVMHTTTAPRNTHASPAVAPRDRAATGFERTPRMDASDRTGWRFERSEPAERHTNPRDSSRR